MKRGGNKIRLMLSSTELALLIEIALSILTITGRWRRGLATCDNPCVGTLIHASDTELRNIYQWSNSAINNDHHSLLVARHTILQSVGLNEFPHLAELVLQGDRFLTPCDLEIPSHLQRQPVRWQNQRCMKNGHLASHTFGC